MARIDNRNKQNPKLLQAELSDGRASLYLEYYLGRSETPVLDDDGQQVLYTEGGDERTTEVQGQARTEKRKPQSLYMGASALHTGAVAKQEYPRARRENKV